MRISDWSSDVCSSDLLEAMRRLVSSVSVASWAICILLYLVINAGRANRVHACDGRRLLCDERQNARKPSAPPPGKWSLLEQGERKSVVKGKRGSVSVELGGRGGSKKKKIKKKKV